MPQHGLLAWLTLVGAGEHDSSKLGYQGGLKGGWDMRRTQILESDWFAPVFVTYCVTLDMVYMLFALVSLPVK